MPKTNALKNNLAEAMETGSFDIPLYVSIGRSNATFDESDTDLTDSIMRVPINNTVRVDNTVEYQGTITEAQANGETIKETGLHVLSTGGDMYVRQTLFDINKTSAFEYDIIYVMELV